MSEQNVEKARRADVTPSGVAALRMAADNVPLRRPGQPWEGAAEWLHRRADAIEAALSLPSAEPDYAYSGPCIHCGHLPDEHGAEYACERHGCRGKRYTPGPSLPPGLCSHCGQVLPHVGTSWKESGACVAVNESRLPPAAPKEDDRG